MSNDKEILSELKYMNKTLQSIDISLGILAGQTKDNKNDEADVVSIGKLFGDEMKNLQIPSFMGKKELKNGPEC